MTIGTVMFIMLLMLSTQSTTIAQYCIKFIVNIILYAVLFDTLKLFWTMD